MSETADGDAAASGDHVARRLERLVTVPEGYERSCRLLGVSAAPETVLAGSYALAVAVWLLGVAALAVGAGPVALVVGAGSAVAAVGVALAGRYGVGLAAQAKRIRALGAAPSLVATLVLGMALWPTTERAAAFAAIAGDGLLADSLDAHRRRASRTPRSGLDAFAREWDGEFPALAQSLTRIERAAVVTREERAELLDAARRTVLRGTRDEMASFAADLRAPATALYAFGVLLPLAMVALLPAVGAAGVPVSTPLLVVLYGIALPAGLVVASAWLLAGRPVAFPPAPVPRSHPDVSTGAIDALVTAAAIAVGSWVAGTVLLPAWAPPIAALGLGTGSALVVYYRPVRAVRDRVRTVEDGLPAALSAIGRRVERGESVEAAFDAAVDASPDPLSSVLAETVERQGTLGVDVETAFRGEHGTLSTLPSPRLRRAAVLLGVASDIGPPAGETIATMGDHLEELAEVERETRRQLAQVTGTLSNTAAFFGPLVGGATVAMSATMGSGGPIQSVSAASLGPVVGWYCLSLAAVLTALSTGLNRGLDRALVGYRVGLALCSSTVVYCVSTVATGLLV
ncbi:type II secretion system protein [Haloarcula onubensis]|uniref:Type II secretion system protein n=1 Tax=Haloarcula onubensis TaxID=2950539 RepID=A0ABU2FK87_9EURY|nr:type II secretion system protein [Halomicroarcula sp. S3CR25-11]MDS0281150.1 type II secretion system protein [Halomicroarcula sp. S3CR25-11]